jgi:hypothetical protein
MQDAANAARRSSGNNYDVQVPRQRIPSVGALADVMSLEQRLPPGDPVPGEPPSRGGEADAAALCPVGRDVRAMAKISIPGLRPDLHTMMAQSSTVLRDPYRLPVRLGLCATEGSILANH